MSNFLNLLYSWLYYHYIALLITIIFTCVLACNSMFSISILFFSFWLYETACGTFLIRDQTCNLYSGLDHSTTREAPVLPLLCLTSFSWDGCTRIFACWCLFRMFPVWTSYWICLVTQSCLTLCDPVDCVAQQGPLLHWDSWGKNIGAQVTMPSSRGSSQPRDRTNPGFPHCRRILYCLSHQGNLRILEWVAMPSSRGSSQPRNWTRVSCFAGRFFTSWAIRES